MRSFPQTLRGFLVLLRFLFSIRLVQSFDAEPSVCIVQYNSGTNSFSETLIYDAANPPLLYAFVCTKTFGSCINYGVNLLPSVSHDCFRGTNKPELIVDSTTSLIDFFTPSLDTSAPNLWRSTCKSSVYYDYNICQRDSAVPSSDRSGVTPSDLFPNTATTSVLRNPVPPSTICPEQRCNQEGTSSHAWWRTIPSFTVGSAGTHALTLRGMAKDDTVHTHNPDGTSFEFLMGSSTCPAGSQLVGTSCVPCIVGKYKIGEGTEECASCQPGKYGVVEGATMEAEGCSACPAGSYGSSSAAPSVNSCVLCAAGKYCDAHSSDNFKLCHAGYQGSLGESLPQCNSPCPAGAYCLNGTAIGNEIPCGSHSTCTDSTSICWCPLGSIQPAHAAPGQYTYGSPAGTSNQMTSVANCNPGTYCQNGIQTTCPPGTYCDSFSMFSPGPLCSAGFYCPAGSSSRQQQTCSNGATCDKYCPEGTEQVMTASNGFYTLPLTAPCTEKTSIQACPADSLCTNGVRSPRLEYLGDVASCGLDSNQLSISMNENTPDTLLLTLQVTEHSTSTAVQVPVAGFSILTSICADNNNVAFPFEIAAGNGAGAAPIFRTKSTANGGAIQYVECRNYNLELKVSDSANEFNSTCSITVTVIDTNNAPVWSTPTLVDRFVRERSPKGTTVTLAANGMLAASIVALDADVGQEITYETIATYPASKEGDLTLTRCGGVITVQSAALLYPLDIILCVRACDDPTFFGGSVPACTPSANGCTNITVVLENVNDPPTFQSVAPCSTNSPCTIAESSDSGSLVSGGNLMGTAVDQDGDALEWYLTSTGSEKFTIGRNDGLIVAGSIKTDFEVTRAYTLTVMVTDNSNEQQHCVSSWCESLLACCATRQIRIDVQNVNDPPLWPNDFATNTQFSIAENSPVGTQIGSAFAASDQDQGSSITYYVNDTERDVLINGVHLPSRVRVDNIQSGTSSLGQLVVDSFLDYETNATILVNVVAMDDQHAKALVENIQIAVTDVNEPTTIVNTTINVVENTNTGTSVLTMSTVSWTDPDQEAFGVSLLFSLMASTFQSTFHISTEGFMLLVNDVDFETLTVNPIVLPFQGAQSDAPTLKTNVAYIHVHVLDQNEPPVGTDVTVQLHEWVPSGSTVDGMTVLTFDAVDPDNNINSWILLSASNSFAVSEAGVLTIATASGLNYEDSPVINLQVRVLDSNGLMDNVACQITLLDVNDPPTITTTQTVGDSSTWFSVSKHNSGADPSSEFGATGGVVGTVTANDQDDSATANGTYTLSLVNEYTSHTNGVASSTNTFTVSSAGVITVAAITTSLETEASTYKLSINVQDNGSPPASSVQDVYVIVIAENFRPTMSEVTVNVVEADPTVSTLATMTANDPDGNNANIVYSISSVLPDLRAGDGERAFVLDTITTVGSGIINVNDGYTLDFETTKWQTFAQGIVRITVQAVDQNGAATVAHCVVSIQDINEAPRLEPSSYQIGEDWTVGTSLGASLQATDPDAADTPNNGALKYTTTNSHFSITLTGGTVATTQALDFETIPVFDVQIVVTDTAFNSVSAGVKVNVLDINETPSVASITTSVLESSTPGSVIAVVNANDPDKASMTSISFQVTNVVPSLKTNFSISQATPLSAYLRHTSLFDYEDVPTYSVQITVNDHGVGFPFANPSAGGSSTSLTATGVVTVNVEDVNDIHIESIQVNGVLHQAHLTTGGDFVDLVGTNLGPTVSSSATVSAYYGPNTDLRRYTAASCVFRAPFSTVVRCTTVAGVGNNLLWSLVIGQFNYTSNSLRTTYSIPQITATGGATEMSTKGGAVINIIGTSFGPAATQVTSNVLVRYGTLSEFQAGHWHLANNCVVAVAHITIRCNSIPSSGSPLSWMVVVGGQQSVVFSSADSGYLSSNVTQLYGIAKLGDVAIPNVNALSTLGGQTIEMMGENFGPLGSTSLLVTYGNFEAVQCTLVEDHVKIRCTTAPGCGRALPWSVQIGPTDGFPESSLTSVARLNDPNIQISYAIPTLTQVSGDHVLAASTSGDDFVLIKGSRFGPSAGCNSNCRSTKICGNVVGAQVHYHSKQNPSVKYEAQCCEILSDTSIQCLMAPGSGRDLQWKVEVCGQSSVLLDTATAYGAPVIGSYGAAGSRSLHTEGGETITLNGINFGPANAGNIESVTFGSGNGTQYALDSSDCHVSVAHRQITCTTTKGGGKNHKWAVMISGQKSTVPTTSYQRPVITSITGPGASNASMVGGETVLIAGDNFGPLVSFHQISFLDSVFYGPASDPYLYNAKNCVVVASSTAINCTTVPGNGKLLRWIVTVAGQPSSLSTATTSYGDPILLSMIPYEGPTSGFLTTLVGINLAPSVFSNPLLSVMFGTQEISLNIIITNTGTYSQPSGLEIQHVTFTAPSSFGLNIPVQYRIYTSLDKTSYQASNSILANYSLPQLSSIHVTDSKSSMFPFKITLEGENFCQNTECSVLKVNGQPLDRSNVLQYGHKTIAFQSESASGAVVLSWKEPYTLVSQVTGSFASRSPTLHPSQIISSNTGIPTCSQTGSGEEGIVTCDQMSTAGGVSFTVKGIRLGTNINLMQVLVGGNAAAILSADLFSTPQSITVAIPPGQGLNNDVRVTHNNVGSRIDSLVKISYAPPEILSQNSATRRIANQAGLDLRNYRAPRVSTKGATVRIFGSNFGVYGAVELRSSSSGLIGTVLPILSWNHGEVKVQVPSGFGINFQVFITVGGQTSLSAPFGYEPPIVERYNLLSNNGGTTGGDHVEIVGTGFFTTATVTIGGAACTVLSCNHTKMIVMTPEGAGIANPIVVTIGHAFVSNSDIHFAYPAPRLEAMTPNHAPTSGLSIHNNEQLQMMLIGRNFGSNKLIATDRQLFFDGVDVSMNVISANHTHLVMTVPPHTTSFTRRTNIVVRVEIKGSSTLPASLTTYFHYDPPTIVSAKVLSCSFASGRSCTPGFPVPTDGCHDWSFPRQRVTGEASVVGSSGPVATPKLDKITWVDDSVSYFRSCVNPVYIELVGFSLGSHGTKFVLSVEDQYNASNSDCTDATMCTHSHRRVVTRSPYGFGPPPMNMYVSMQQQNSNKVPWSFAPPQVAYRGSCGYWSTEDSSQCRLPYNARGTPFVASDATTAANSVSDTVGADSTEETTSRIVLEIAGSNFGHQNPGDVRVVIGSRECTNAKWIKVHPDTGTPYITCYPDEDVVGVHAGSIYLGGQNASVNINREAFVATCQPTLPSQKDGSVVTFYGQSGQLCSTCPTGALCGALPEDDPISKVGFYRLKLPTTLPTTDYSIIDKKNYDRAQGFNNEVRRCSLQQLMNKDLSPELVSAYPYAARPTLCYDFVACEPQAACVGNNKCGVGYEYLLHQCQNWEDVHHDACIIQNVPLDSTCSNTMKLLNGSAMVHSSGTLQGIPDPTILPTQYRIHVDDSSTDTCLIIGNNPVLDDTMVAKCQTMGGVVLAGMKNRTCQTDLDCNSRSGVGRAPGAECTAAHPEDCSKCVMHTTKHGASFGMCSCSGSTRCSLCTVGGTPFNNGTTMKGYFRQDNECVQCPDSPWLLFATFAILVVLIVIGAYVLNKKKMNMSFISIGVDYFQVLSLFRNAKTKWPPQLLTFFRLFSIFMMDIDIAAPECIVPSLEYSTKWWGTMAIPFVILIVLFLMYIGQWCLIWVKRKLKPERRSSVNYKTTVGPDKNALIQLYITFFYYAYIMLAEKGLEVFNCNPTNPDDGFTYTDFTSSKFCDGGLCRCYDPSQLQNTLIVPAVVLLLVYGLGFPIFVIVIVLRNKLLIKEDQLLRASHLGDTQETNPYAFQVRQRYSKLYYHFKPGKVYWMEYIIGRKVGIAFAGLFFRANPGFQLSFVLLILFVSYVFQVKHRPYMSTSERIIVVEEHMMKVIMASELEAEGLKIPNSLKSHQIFAEHLRVATENKQKVIARAKRDKRGDRRKMTNLDQISKDMIKEKREDEHASYFFDYNTGTFCRLLSVVAFCLLLLFLCVFNCVCNCFFLSDLVVFFFKFNTIVKTVEQYLLASLILICLSGIMFESDRFASDTEAVGNHFDWQRELITVMVFTVIALSLLYYAMVFIAEVWTTPQWLHRWQERKHIKKGKRKSTVDETKKKTKKRGGRRDSMQILGDSLQKQAQEILLERKIKDVRNEERVRLNNEMKSKEQLIAEQNAKIEQLQINEIDQQTEQDRKKGLGKKKPKESPHEGTANQKGRKGKGKRRGKKGRSTKKKKFERNKSSFDLAIGVDDVEEINEEVKTFNANEEPGAADAANTTGMVQPDEQNAEPQHVHADWWLYTRGAQKYYYNSVTQQSVWNKKDVPELAALGDDNDDNEDKIAVFGLNNPMAAAQLSTNIDVTETKAEPIAPKKTMKSIKSLWGSKKANMRLRLRQKKLWDKQAGARKRKYEKQLRAKSNWQKGAMLGLLAKRKSEGNNKGMLDLVVRRGSMVAKLKKMAHDEKKKNDEANGTVGEGEEAWNAKPLSFVDKVKAQIAKEKKEEEIEGGEGEEKEATAKATGTVTKERNVKAAKNTKTDTTTNKFFSNNQMKSLRGSLKTKKNSKEKNVPVSSGQTKDTAADTPVATEKTSEMTKKERVAKNIGRMKRVTMVARAANTIQMWSPMSSETTKDTVTQKTPSMTKKQRTAQNIRRLKRVSMVARAAKTMRKKDATVLNKVAATLRGKQEMAPEVVAEVEMKSLVKKSNKEEESGTGTTPATSPAHKSTVKNIVGTKGVETKTSPKSMPAVDTITSRAPIRKGRSKFGDRLRRSSAMSMSLNKAKKDAGHRELALKKK